MPRLNPGDEKLSAQQFDALHSALVDAYSSTSDFDLMLRARRGLTLASVAALPQPMPGVVRDVIGDAEDKSWTAQLLDAARASRSENAKLLAVAQLFGMATATPARQDLELRIDEANGTLDVVRWREGLARSENRVCRIELTDDQGKPRGVGTGFLVGSDVVLTNFHVMQAVIKDPSLEPRIGARFDFKRRSDGVTINEGVVHRLATVWNVDSSPFSQLDLQVDPPGAPAADELDYSLVRLAEPAGDLPVTSGEAAELGAPARGWIELPATKHPYQARPALFILQHPDGRPLELAIDTNAVTAVVPPPPADAPTRVRYRTNTEPGSSGSPCFDADWNLIALHHSGDPRHSGFGVKPEYNEGIPIAAIRSLLESRGKASELGKHEL